MSTTKKGKQSAKSTRREGFTAEEKAAMRARARELKAQDGRGKRRARRDRRDGAARIAPSPSGSTS